MLRCAATNQKRHLYRTTLIRSSSSTSSSPISISLSISASSRSTRPALPLPSSPFYPFHPSRSPSSLRYYSAASSSQKSFFTRLKSAWNETPIKWYPIPVGLGIGYLGFKRYTQVMQRERQRIEDEQSSDNGDEPPKKRRKVRMSGPWQVQILSTLPLKALSRLWGRFNEIPLPTPLRPIGFNLYAWIFGVNTSEALNTDLYSYRNLAEFFYREINPACRPIDPTSAIVSPSDGKVLMLGEVREGGRVENVKGMTYSLDALLSGQVETRTSTAPSSPAVEFSLSDLVGDGVKEGGVKGDNAGEVVDSHEEFARVNGISYTVSELFSGQDEDGHTVGKAAVTEGDQSLPRGEGKDEQIQAEVGAKPTIPTSSAWFRKQTDDAKKRLYFAVIYLAPGDYHRFHSPTEWVVETRRHFAGELFSVSPYLQSLLPSLFILNERVALLGRWKFGFFSMVPVGATNVGSIVLNFDRELRTNSLTKDTKADMLEGHGYAEAHYKLASKILEGHPLRRGEEMGGFRLGSTIVLVFEAPEGKEGQEGADGTEGKTGFRWIVEKGSKVKMGQALGVVE